MESVLGPEPVLPVPHVFGYGCTLAQSGVQVHIIQPAGLSKGPDIWQQGSRIEYCYCSSVTKFLDSLDDATPAQICPTVSGLSTPGLLNPNLSSATACLGGLELASEWVWTCNTLHQSNLTSVSDLCTVLCYCKSGLSHVAITLSTVPVVFGVSRLPFPPPTLVSCPCPPGVARWGSQGLREPTVHAEGGRPTCTAHVSVEILLMVLI